MTNNNNTTLNVTVSSDSYWQSNSNKKYRNKQNSHSKDSCDLFTIYTTLWWVGPLWSVYSLYISGIPDSLWPCPVLWDRRSWRTENPESSSSRNSPTGPSAPSQNMWQPALRKEKTYKHREPCPPLIRLLGWGEFRTKTYIFVVPSVDVHLTESKERQHKVRGSELRRLVVVLEGLVIVLLQQKMENHRK